jgi:oligo-1,6-glucosidase
MSDPRSDAYAAASPATPWWKDVVGHQIYPRSFYDSNGDGIGDLPGITAKLDYLQTLGVDVIWLSPHFDSPNVDNGYDVRDYRKVMAEFGTMADFDRLLAALHERGMRLIVDLVVNHTSDQHHWFVESRRSKDSPYRDYYVWRDGRADGGSPNNYPSFFRGSAWQLDRATGQYYLHYFARQQPDLNWENARVRAEVVELMRFWLDKGVAGFRMDVIPFISKDDALADLTPEQLDHPEFVYASGPRVHEHLQLLQREALAPYDAMSVGEAFGVGLDERPLFTYARRG